MEVPTIDGLSKHLLLPLRPEVLLQCALIKFWELDLLLRK